MEDAVSDVSDVATERIRIHMDVEDAVVDVRDVVREHIRIAGYSVKRRRSELPLTTLLLLKYEIERAIHVPVTLAALEEDVQNPCRVHGKTWSGALEGVSRSVVAYHKAIVATEDDSCTAIVNRLHCHARTLMSKLKAAVSSKTLRTDLWRSA